MVPVDLVIRGQDVDVRLVYLLRTLALEVLQFLKLSFGYLEIAIFAV